MNFDRLAPHYDWMEALSGARLLQRARTCWLEALRGRAHIVSVGEGHGRFAEACVRHLPESELTCVEASGRMLARAQARLKTSPATVRWRQTGVLAWTPEKQYDAVVTCFFLDCFPPDTLAAVVEKLAGAASTDAVWLVVDFAVPPRGYARWRALAVHKLMYFFFRFAVGLPAHGLTPPDDLLAAHGFRLEGRREFSHGLLRADVWRRG